MKRLSTRTSRTGMIGMMLAIILVLAACSSPAANNSTPSALPATGGETVRSATAPQFGEILVTTDGMALYTNTADSATNLICVNADCTNIWIPYTASAQPTAGEGIPGSLGTVKRPDGSTQVTYNQQPLYMFYLDQQAGEVKGDGISDAGGTWHVATLGSAPAGGTPAGGSGGGYNQPSGIDY